MPEKKTYKPWKCGAVYRIRNSTAESEFAVCMAVTNEGGQSWGLFMRARQKDVLVSNRECMADDFVLAAEPNPKPAAPPAPEDDDEDEPAPEALVSPVGRAALASVVLTRPVLPPVVEEPAAAPVEAPVPVRRKPGRPPGRKARK
jgi:hypothetical protein